MMFIDVDEFIFQRTTRRCRTPLLGYEDLPGLVLPWRIFGYSDHKRRPSRKLLRLKISKRSGFRTQALAIQK